jgi:hypothetical protein
VRYGVIYVALWYVNSAYLWLGVDLMLVKRILGHSTLNYLRSFIPALTTGLIVSTVMFGVQFFLPTELAPWLRLTLELISGGLLLLVLHAKLFLNPRRSLRAAGLIPKTA